MTLWEQAQKRIREDREREDVRKVREYPALLARAEQAEREAKIAKDEAAQDIRAAIALDKSTFEGVGRSTKGHARALMLIDEYRADLTAPTEGTTNNV